MASKNKNKNFKLKFSSEELLTGNRKKDSNYYRRKISSKKIAYIYSLIKNINQLVIMSSFVLPKIKTGLIDRFLILADRFKVKPIIILSKSDLVDDKTINYYKNIYRLLDIQVRVISNLKKSSVVGIEKIFTNNKSAIIGHSGVGKTTLLNNLDPGYHEKTQEISSFTKKGRHTTTRILMHELSFGGIVYDMPGLKEMDYIDINKNDLKNYYHEFNKYQTGCLYKNCSHTHEPNCNIRKVVKQNLIHPERYQNYLKILPDLEK